LKKHRAVEHFDALLISANEGMQRDFMDYQKANSEQKIMMGGLTASVLPMPGDVEVNFRRILREFS
jgi:hypothetical protein